MSVLSLASGPLISLSLSLPKLSTSTGYFLLCTFVPSLTSRSELRFPAFVTLRVWGGSTGVALEALRVWGGIVVELVGIRRF